MESRSCVSREKTGGLIPGSVIIGTRGAIGWKGTISETHPLCKTETINDNHSVTLALLPLRLHAVLGTVSKNIYSNLSNDD